MRAIVAAALLLAGCANLPPLLRAPTAREFDARDALLAAWVEAGREVPAGWRNRPIHVYEAPQADVTAWCKRPPTQPVMGCSWTQAPYLGAPFHTYVLVSATGGENRTHFSLVIHELAHQLRGAWVMEAAGGDDYLRRLRAGGTLDAPVAYPTDVLHRDLEQRAIEQRALDLLEQ